MKLSSKLPKRNGLVESNLPVDLLARPRARRLLVVEVVAEKIERIYDEEEGYEYEVPTMRVVSGEYLTDPRDISSAQVLAQRAKARRTGADTLPGVDAASILRHGKGLLTANTVGIDPETGEIIDGGGKS